MRERGEIRTARLALRRWRPADREPFAILNADQRVMRHLPGPLTRKQSDDLVEVIEAGFARCGYGLWALELLATGEFVGFTGLATVSMPAHFAPAVEVGWRLARSAWGRGYATEAACAALAFGFDAASLAEIVSLTTIANRRSRAVMRRIGMRRDPADDFDHPELPKTSALRAHVLYRITACDWRARAAPTARG